MPSDTDPRADTVAASSDPTVEPTLTPEQAGDTRASGPGPGGGAVGSMIGGRYRLQSALGRGGMAEVLSAVDKQLGREVAVKRMRRAGGAEAVARFEREARIQGRLDRSAIVPVHELAYDDAGQPYFVMKRLTGVTLAAYLADRSDEGQARCSRNRMLRAFVDVCLAVAFAHRRGVVHRDLKPANIVLGDFGEVYVLDWGVARWSTRPTMPLPAPAPPAISPAGPPRSVPCSARPATSRPSSSAARPSR